MLILSEVLEKINGLEKGEKITFKADGAYENFQSIYSQLEQLQANGVIHLAPHQESKTGDRWIDLVFVEKL